MIGVGEILWDLLPQGRQLGGAPANFAYHASQLGSRGVVVSCVGSDEDGQAILSQLNRKGIEYLIEKSSRYPTGKVTVQMRAGVMPAYTIHRDAAWDHLRITDKHLQLAKAADVICYGSLAQRSSVSADAITKLISHTPDKTIRVFDINLRQDFYSKEVIKRLLTISTVVKLNDDEMEEIAAMLDLRGGESEKLAKLSDLFNLDLVILTKGRDGSRLFSKNIGDSSIGGADIGIVDTVGAGDSFTAAVATGLVRQFEIGVMHRLASRVAAYVCTKRGATPELPSVEELLKE